MNITVEQLHLSQWQGAAQDMLYMLLQNPTSQPQFTIFAVVCFLVCRWTFIRVVHAMNLNDVGFLQHFITTALGIGGVVFALAAVKIYKPALLTAPDSVFYIAGIIIAASLVLSVPLINIYMRENYFKTLLAWSVSVFAVIGAIMILGVLSDAFFQGLGSFEKGKKHNEDTMQMLK